MVMVIGEAAGVASWAWLVCGPTSRSSARSTADRPMTGRDDILIAPFRRPRAWAMTKELWPEIQGGFASGGGQLARAQHASEPAGRHRGESPKKSPICELRVRSAALDQTVANGDRGC